MTTREEQIEKAQEIARLNPEWMWTSSMEDLFRPMSGDCTWLSVVDDRWRIGNGMGESFGSPAAAIRKLGFDVKEEG